MPDEAVNTPPGTIVAPADDARRMLRRATRATLATLDRTSGYPYASLVAMATESDGAPILLLSRLALHTQNIDADPRASLLVDSGSSSGDPLAAGRVSLMGRVQRAAGSTAAQRFLAVHPAAEAYAGFADFGFFGFHIERAHYVGGFGRISSLAAADLLVDTTGAANLIAAEPDLLAAINREHGSRLARLGAQVSRGRAGDWRATGIDPAGIDLTLADIRCRCDFAESVTTADRALKALNDLFEAA